MSTPTNPLASYKSYSYFHALIACDSTETIKRIIDSAEFDDPLSLSEIAGGGGQIYKDRTRAPVSGISGSYSVIINGSRDVDLVISELEFTSVILPQATTNSAYALTSAQMGVMKIFELKDASFVNILIETAKALKVPSLHMVPYILKTYFVGVKEDGTQDFITNINPLTIMFTDITAIIDQTGSTYTAQFVNLGAGLGMSTPHTSKVNIDKITVTSSDGSNRLMSVMTHFESQLNLAAKLDYDRQVQALQNNGSNATTKVIQRKFKMNVAAPYDSAQYTVQGAPQIIDTGAKNAPPYFMATAEDSANIMNLFDTIFKACPQIARDDNVVTPPLVAPSTIFPKVYCRSEMVKVDNSETYEELITYSIVPFKMNYNQNTQFISGDPAIAVPGNSITFDYIYTGKNTDVLEFDLRINNLTAILYGSEESGVNLFPIPQSANDAAVPAPVVDQKTAVSGFVDPALAGTPAMPPRITASTVTGETETNQTYEEKLAMMAGYSGIDSKMVIIGNPYLMSDMATPITNTPIPSPDVNPSADSVAKYWQTGIVLVKLNVKLPSSEGIGGSVERSNPIGALKPFWYQGWYMLQQVDSKFSNGQFVQTLSLIAKMDGKS